MTMTHIYFFYHFRRRLPSGIKHPPSVAPVIIQNIYKFESASFNSMCFSAKLALSITILFFVASLSQVDIVASLQNTSCRYLPGDSCWPKAQEWNQLNETVGGRLIATAPLGSPCHDPTYNAAECSSLQKQ
jgi:hypothetical protein